MFSGTFVSSSYVIVVVDDDNNDDENDDDCYCSIATLYDPSSV